MTKTIVIVEDDKDIRENYIDLLTRQKCHVVGYADRPSAERAFNGQLADRAITTGRSLSVQVSEKPVTTYYTY